LNGHEKKEVFIFIFAFASAHDAVGTCAIFAPKTQRKERMDLF